MNRKQRRAEKKAKSHNSAHKVNDIDMRSHIDRLLKNDPYVRQVLQEEAHRANLEETRKQNCDILTLILMSLHKSKEKMGRKRLLRFCHTFNELQKYYEDFYEDCDMFAMRKLLKEEVGIDVEHINDEIERFLNENPDER